MTQEEKSLLLRDLCARLPYGVICKVEKYNGYENRIIEGYSNGYFLTGITEYEIDEIVPYLRSMDDMTEEEKRELFEIGCEGNIEHPYGLYFRCQDWLNAHHFDYRGLIEKGLALEAKEEMYNIKENNYGNNKRIGGLRISF